MSKIYIDGISRERTLAEQAQYDADNSNFSVSDPPEKVYVDQQILSASIAAVPDSVLLDKDFRGLSKEVKFNTDGTVNKIQYKNAENAIVREDSFAYTESVITETRTILSTEATLTLIHNLTSMETEVT